MSTNIKYDYYVPYPTKNMKLSLFQLDIHMSAYQKLTKNHIKYVFICKISFKLEVFLPVYHETSHMDPIT